MPAIGTSPTVVTVAMRSPLMITGTASGTSTLQPAGRVYPIAVADSRTESGTPSIPATMLRNRIWIV